MIMSVKPSKSSSKKQLAGEPRGAYYTSLEQWEAENFPNLAKRKVREKLEQDPKALGIAIADDVFQSVRSRLIEDR